MFRSVFVAATAAVLLAAGALGASAGNRHTGQAAALRGQAITSLTSGAALEIKAMDDEESAQAAAAKAAAEAAATAQAQSSEQQVQADEQSGTDADDQQDTTDEQDATDGGDSGD
jgi:hypothetical protein